MDRSIRARSPFIDLAHGTGTLVKPCKTKNTTLWTFVLVLGDCVYTDPDYGLLVWTHRRSGVQIRRVEKP